MGKKKSRRPKSKPTPESVAIQPAAAPKTPPPLPPSLVRDNLWRSFLYWFLCVTFVGLPFGIAPGYMNPYNKTYFVIVLAAVVSLLALAIAITKRKLPLIYSPFFAAIGGWLLVKLITTATSIEPVKSFWGTYNSWSDSFLFGLSVAIIVVVILTLYLEHTKIVLLLRLLIAQATILAGATLWEAYKSGFFYQKVRPSSPLLNSDFFLSYGLLFLPLIVVLLVRHIRRKNLLPTCLYGLSTLLLAGALFVTLPTHLQTILLPSLLNGKPDSTYYGSTDQSAGGITNFTQTDANLERWTEWKIGITLGERRPLVGTGPGTTGQAFLAYNTSLDLKGWDHSHVMNRSHNDIIEQFSEEGLLGLAAYLALIVTFAWIVVRRWKSIDTPNRPYAWGLAGGLLLWLGFNLFLFTTLVAGLVAWTWMALLLTMVKSPREITSIQRQKLARGSLVALVLVMSVAGYWIVRYYLADASVTQAMRINTGFKNGTYNHLNSQDQVGLQLQAESDARGAADDLPFEGYYSFQAAEASINTYFGVSFTSSADAQLRKDNAVRYAHQAVNDDPDSPENLLALGGIQYYLAPAGSAPEQQGLALINHGIALTSRSVAWYLEAAQIVALKKNYPLATTYIQRGLRQTAQKDHSDLQKLGRTIKQEQDT